MKLGHRTIISWIAVAVLAGASVATAQTTYQPKFHGDPARSESEAAALGYMRHGAAGAEGISEEKR